jgi:ABC-type multidrug transport system ATPase subunit
VSFEAHAGEALALWGANGAGKTTLIKAVLGLIDFEGQIEVEGHDVRRTGKSARRSIGYVPQEAIFYDLSVQATMEFYARLKHGRGVQLPAPGPQAQVSAPARIPELLDRLGLAGHARKPVPALSGGLKQRLALALALLADPPVLLLDEPTASLDAEAQHEYLALLAKLRSEEHKTIIFASHRLEEVEALANRVLVLEQGRLVDVLNPVDLLARLMPEIQLTLYVPEAQRRDALARLADAGLAAHLNGRGTVVVHVRAEHKMRPLQTLLDCGITVTNFETAGTVE